MGYLFLLLWLISPLFLIVGMIKPSSLQFLFRKTPKRLNVLAVFLGLFVGLFILAGTTLPPSKENITPSKPFPTATKTPQVTLTTVSPTKTASNEAKMYVVSKVVDGDTIKVEIEGRYETVRLIGIDTPETVDPRKPVECFGKEASIKISELLKDGKVALELDNTQGDKDKYNRLLRYVFLADGTHINNALIKQGYAHEYTYNLPYKYQSEFKTAEKDARDNKRGLWADNVCISSVPSLVPSNTVVPPSATPWPTSELKPTAQPTVANYYVPPTTAPVVPAVNSGSGFVCDCSKACTKMASCEEAYFQLNNCQCSARDADDDGVPCESMCPGG